MHQPYTSTQSDNTLSYPACVCCNLGLNRYVMKHYPGNTNASWERQFYADIAHGVDRFDLFHLVPSTSGYTCDYVDADGGAYVFLPCLQTRIC